VDFCKSDGQKLTTSPESIIFVIVGVCGILTCYLRLVGYLAVSFKCPYRASVDPACSCLFQMNSQVHNRYFRVTNTRDYILMSIRYFPVVTDYFEYQRRVAHWHSWWIDYNNSASQPPVLCLRRTRPAWCEAEIKHVQQRAGENNLKLNTSKSKQMIFLQRHAWALSVSIGTLCSASSSTTNYCRRPHQQLTFIWCQPTVRTGSPE